VMSVHPTYLAWQPMVGFKDMTKPFGLSREEGIWKCFAENDWITMYGRFGVLLLNLCLNDLGSNRNLLFDRLPLRGSRMPANG
jgi:hypothetical protein